MARTTPVSGLANGQLAPCAVIDHHTTHYETRLHDRRLTTLCVRWDRTIRDALQSDGLDANEVKKWFHGYRVNHKPLCLVRWLWKEHSTQYVMKRCGVSESTVNRWLNKKLAILPKHYAALLGCYDGDVDGLTSDGECVADAYVTLLNKLREQSMGAACFQRLDVEVWELMVRAWVSEKWSDAAAKHDGPELDRMRAAFIAEARAQPWFGLWQDSDPPIEYRIFNPASLIGQMRDWEPVLCLALGALAS